MAKTGKKKKNDDKVKKLNDEVFKEAVDDFDRFEDFFSTNLNTILVVCVVIAVAGTITAMVYQHIETKRLAAAATLVEADKTKSIESALTRHPDNPAANVARMKLATMRFNKKDYVGAMQLYKEVAANAPVGDLRTRAALNVAYTLEAMGKFDEAAEKFLSISSNPTIPSSRKNEAAYSAARLFFLSGKNKRAKNALKRLAFGRPGFWASQGKQLEKRLN
jgi:predicted negative regulator of RcsB-dependent stress response